MIVNEYNQQLLDPDGKNYYYHSESESHKSTPDFIICAQHRRTRITSMAVE